MNESSLCMGFSFSLCWCSSTTPNHTLQKQGSHCPLDEALSLSLCLPASPLTFFSPYLNYSPGFCRWSPAVPGTEPRVLHMLGKRYLSTSSGLPLSSRGKQALVTVSQTRKQNQRDQVHSQVHGTVVSDTHFLMPIFPALLANRKSRGTDIVRVTRT